MGVRSSKHHGNKAERVDEVKHKAMAFLGIELSGKSAFLRQIEQLTGKYNCEYDVEMMAHSLLNCTSMLIEAADALNLTWGAGTRTAIDNIQELINSDKHLSMKEVPENLIEGFISIWTDPNVMQILCNLHKRDFLLFSSAYYFASYTRTLLEPGYIPTERDRMAMRIHTSIVQQNMEIKKNGEMQVVRAIDAGGGTRGRHRWRNMFEDTQAIVYFINLTHFYRSVHMHGDENRMEDSLSLFNDIANSKFGNLASMEVTFILTHGDVLQEQLKFMTLEDVKRFNLMSDYSGEMNVKSIAEYIVDLYAAKDTVQGRQKGYLYADPWNYEPVVTKFLNCELYYRGINDPKQVSFETPFNIH